MAPAPQRGRRASTASRPPAGPPLTLQQQYAAATRPLSLHFAQIDAWLVDNEPAVWQQLHQADDELFQLSQLKVSESRYQAALEAFVARCEEAEQLYYEAHPSEFRLAPLSAGERVAVYYELGDGSMHKVSGEER